MIDQEGKQTLRLDRTVILSGLRIGKKEEWIAELEMDKQSSLEVGVVSQVGGVLFNKEPILLTKRGNHNLLQGTLLPGKGTLTISWRKEGSAIPRF
jgi:hypothetical protein